MATMDKPILTGANRRIREFLRRGVATLDTEARCRIGDFVLSRFNADGGVRGRGSESDLYYTVFGLECASALDMEIPPATSGYLQRVAARELDFVHTTCLLRSLEIAWPDYSIDRSGWRENLAARIRAHCSRSGGFHAKPGRTRGSVYDTFLGMLACESLGLAFPGAAQTISLLSTLQRAGGGFVNQRKWEAATTPVSAAALGTLLELGQAAPDGSLQWLIERSSTQGGFAAAPLVPVPDLLSTATALHALFQFNSLPRASVDGCLDFVIGLWDDGGGFVGHALDRTPDCEYTFYALLALGNLAPAPVS